MATKPKADGLVKIVITAEGDQKVHLGDVSGGVEVMCAADEVIEVPTNVAKNLIEIGYAKEA
jgi:hypothetical protein